MHSWTDPNSRHVKWGAFNPRAANSVDTTIPIEPSQRALCTSAKFLDALDCPGMLCQQSLHPLIVIAPPQELDERKPGKLISPFFGTLMKKGMHTLHVILVGLLLIPCDGEHESKLPLDPTPGQSLFSWPLGIQHYSFS
jgi:hypothetical protein